MLYNRPYLIEEINFGHGICGITRQFHKQHNKSDVGVEGLETFGSDDGSISTVGLECVVRQIYAHLSTETEETRNQIICLQYALLMHL